MKKFIPLLLLGIAFGIIEGSVVIYLRPLLNNNLSNFSLRLLPLKALTDSQRIIALTEVFREAATLILLICAAWLVSKNFYQWLSYFVFTFGVWDIIYYLWLFIRIGWPSTLLDWDILFLIPIPWYAPVIVPITISFIGIIASILVILIIEKKDRIKLKFYHYLPLIISLTLWQISFLNKNKNGMNKFPENYTWSIFFLGICFSLIFISFLVKILLTRK